MTCGNFLNMCNGWYRKPLGIKTMILYFDSLTWHRGKHIIRAYFWSSRFTARIPIFLSFAFVADSTMRMLLLCKVHYSSGKNKFYNPSMELQERPSQWAWKHPGGYLVERWVWGCTAQIGYLFGLSGLPMAPSLFENCFRYRTPYCKMLNFSFGLPIDHFRIVSIRPGWAHSQRRVRVNITIPLHWRSCEWTLTLPIFLVFVRYQQ